jgi:type IV fimbrial biogenesis protein FimT
VDAAKRLRLLSHPNRADQIYAQGFTLHEALVSLTLVGILFVGAMGFGRLVPNTGIATDVNTLLADLALARSEAIKRGQSVTVCQSDSTTDCTGSSSWHQGWVVFADANSNRSVDVDESMLRVQQPLLHGAQVQFRGSGVGRDHYVTYQPSGFATPNGTFTFCDANDSRNARVVIMYWTGRARTSTTKADGDPIDCP